MDKTKQKRSFIADIKTREKEEEGKTIEGYFAVFDEETNLFDEVYEKIDRNAFNNSLDKDVRALINHESSRVLGRTKSKTLELKADERGLYGKIKINENDQDAMNLYERVKRGDVDQCSFGFFINSEEREARSDGSQLYTLTDVDLFEVSVCTFPAYEATGVQARAKQIKEGKREELEDWKKKAKERITNA